MSGDLNQDKNEKTPRSLPEWTGVKVQTHCLPLEWSQPEKRLKSRNSALVFAPEYLAVATSPQGLEDQPTSVMCLSESLGGDRRKR